MVGPFFVQRESYFIVGTESKYGKFMILGVISPRRKILNLGLMSDFVFSECKIHKMLQSKILEVQNPANEWFYE